MNVNTSVSVNYMASDKLTKVSLILLRELLALQLNKLASVEQDGLICPPPFGLTKVSKSLEIKFTHSARVFAMKGNGLPFLCASTRLGGTYKGKQA